MRHKYKVGDYVKIVPYKGHEEYLGMIGRIENILWTNAPFPYKVRILGENNTHYPVFCDKEFTEPTEDEVMAWLI